MLNERRIVVVGAGDIGAAIAERLDRLGAKVCVWDHSERALARFDSEGARLPTQVVDITDEDSVAFAAERAVEILGGVDGLVVTAGVLHLAAVSELSLGDWKRTIDVNLTGTFLCCRALLPALRIGNSPSIVTISSIGGLAGEPEMAHYCASKFGVIGFTQSLAREEGPNGVRVNAVCPGAVDSRMNDETIAMYGSRTGRSSADVRDEMVGQTPLARLATPDDIAGTVAFLVSELSSFITGESIAVTGGLRY